MVVGLERLPANWNFYRVYSVSVHTYALVCFVLARESCCCCAKRRRSFTQRAVLREA